MTQVGTIKAGATFAPLPPSRVVDTTTGAGAAKAPLRAGRQVTFQAARRRRHPDGQRRGARPEPRRAGCTTGNCWVQVQPTGSSSKNASYPRVDAYKTYASQQLAVVAPGRSTGGLTLSTSCRSVDVFADVEGYYLANTDGSPGDVYVPVSKPTRVIDTRQNLGIHDRIGPGRIVERELRGPGGRRRRRAGERHRGRAERRHEQRHGDRVEHDLDGRHDAAGEHQHRQRRTRPDREQPGVRRYRPERPGRRRRHQRGSHRDERPVCRHRGVLLPLRHDGHELRDAAVPGRP